MELLTDRPDRGNPIRCQLTREYLRCLLTQRIRGIRTAGHATRDAWELRITIISSS
jgi:hypothetical protein